MFTSDRLRDRSPEAEGKPSLKRAIVRGHRPEARRSTHGQVEAQVTLSGGLNQLTVKRYWMSCG